MNEVIVSMNNISKSFPGVKALDHVKFELRSGEVMALLGENGAGKSTLMSPFRVCTAGYQLRRGTLSSEAGKQGGTDCYPAEIAEKDRGAQGVGTESPGACK